MLVTQLKASEVSERIVAIVRFGPPTDSDGFRAGEYYQVTVDPEHFSADGLFVRFGEYDGDEIIGWQRADAIYVVSELGKWHTDEKPLLNWGLSPALLDAPK